MEGDSAYVAGNTMPELPDLVYILSYLTRETLHKIITGVSVNQPVVLRIALRQTLEEAVCGSRIESVYVHGAFLGFNLSSGVDLIMNFMLTGRLQHQRPGDRAEPNACLALHLNDSTSLRLCDRKKMAKCYVVPRGDYAAIPSFGQQGIDVLSPAFTLDAFLQLAKRHARKQVRSFLNDHRILSSLGNAYADEILFDARIHPKTFVATLSVKELSALFTSIRTVLQHGIAHVAATGQPIHIKVRDHMQVRMRKGEPCPRCSSTIRREGVRGYDVFFCPCCQPSSRRAFISWK